MTQAKRRTDADLAARVRLLKTDPDRYYRENPRVRFGFQANDELKAKRRTSE